MQRLNLDCGDVAMGDVAMQRLYMGGCSLRRFSPLLFRFFYPLTLRPKQLQKRLGR